MIKEVHERIKFNRTNNRTDIKRYVLSGFLYCAQCGLNLLGQTQNRGDGYVYYRHKGRRISDCAAFSSIAADKIEPLVFGTIFETVGDETGFNEAIKESLPDQTYLKSLKESINRKEKELKKIESNLEKLVDALLEGTMRKDTISKRETLLAEKKEKVIGELKTLYDKLHTLPDLKQVKMNASLLRSTLHTYFRSEYRFEEMSFDEKRNLLHWLFDRTDNEGKDYGVYLKKLGRGKWEAYLYGKMIAGSRLTDGKHWFRFKDYKTNTLYSLLRKTL